MEALMAAAILFAGMLAVMSAIMTGQQKVFEAQLQLQATVLAEDKMQDIVKLDYLAIDSSYDEFQWQGKTVRQRVDVLNRLQALPGLEVQVMGKDVTVTIYLLVERVANPITEEWRTIAELKAFIPAPPS